MSSRRPAPLRHLAPYVLGVPVVVALGIVMVAAVLDLPAGPLGLAGEVQERIDDTGVRHPVTAVLLNLRAYDTWLEVVALLIAAVATLTTRATPLPSREGGAPGAVIVGLAGRLLPVVVLAGVFVLALGTFTSGGAFQAGALVAAGLFLLYLAGAPLARLLGGLGGGLLVITGSAAFLVAALAGLLFGLHALEFAPRWASGVIVAVETAVTLSIVVTLAVLLIAAPPDQPSGDQEPRR